MNQEWLLNLTKQGIETEAFPLHEVLENSLYYPASGLDGSPIRHWSIGVNSFVYADMSVTKASYEEALAHGAFRGYQVLASKQLQSRKSYLLCLRAPSFCAKNTVNRYMAVQLESLVKISPIPLGGLMRDLGFLLSRMTC